MATISQVQINGTTYEIADAMTRDNMSWIQRDNEGNIHFRTGAVDGLYKEYSFEPSGKLYVKVFNEDGTEPSDSTWRPCMEIFQSASNSHGGFAFHTYNNTTNIWYRWYATEYGNLRKDYSTDSGATWTVMQYYPHTEKGSTNVTAPKQAYTDKTVTFSRAFDNTPVVVCNFSGTSTSYQMGNVSCSAINVSTTGFTIRVWNADTTNREPYISWIAVQ